MLHKHHIIPRHAGGTDDPGNLIELTVEEHAEAHRKLYEEHGRWQDKIAWQTLSGQIGRWEANIMAIKETHTGKIVSEETREKQRKAKLGEKNPMYGTESPNKGKFGKNSPRYGKTHSEETKKRLSEDAKNRERMNCPYCGKEDILPAHFGRYHKDMKCMEKQ